MHRLLNEFKAMVVSRGGTERGGMSLRGKEQHLAPWAMLLDADRQVDTAHKRHRRGGNQDVRKSRVCGSSRDKDDWVGVLAKLTDLRRS